jgi:uncharacterized protein (TIGR02001 family)
LLCVTAHAQAQAQAQVQHDEPAQAREPAPWARAGLQWSGSAWAESDRFYRGVSQSQGRPSAGLGLNLDHRSGWYAGGAVAAVELVPGPRRAQTLLHAGVARRFGAGPLGWDVGVQDVRFQDHANRNYLEAYGGVGGPEWALRLHWSPDYYGMGEPAQYLSWQHGGSLPWPTWRWAGRTGALHWSRHTPGHRRWRADAQAGVAVDLGPVSIEAAVVAAQRSVSLYPSSYELVYGSSASRVHGLLRVNAGF